MLQFGASLTDDTRSVNYDHNTFIIQATEQALNCIFSTTFFVSINKSKNSVFTEALVFAESNYGKHIVSFCQKDTQIGFS